MTTARGSGAAPRPAISVLVPTWNEEAQLAACLESLGDPDPAVEVIVADGGSTDRTTAIARERGARVVVSPVRQRAAQLNLAAREARGVVLVFLHADTRLPAAWRAFLEEARTGDPGLVGGAFQRRFDSPSRWLRFTCALADWRGRHWGCFLGDQVMWVRADAFRALGGFPALDRCEDLEFSLRLARAGRTTVLPATVVSSARRFARRGPLGQTGRDLFTAIRHLLTRPRPPSRHRVEADL